MYAVSVSYYISVQYQVFICTPTLLVHFHWISQTKLTYLMCNKGLQNTEINICTHEYVEISVPTNT